MKTITILGRTLVLRLMLVLFVGFATTSGFAQNSCRITGDAPSAPYPAEIIESCASGPNLVYRSTPSIPSTYLWTFQSNTSGASIVGSDTGNTVTINPGSLGGSFFLICTVTGIDSPSEVNFCGVSVAVYKPTVTGVPAARCGAGEITLGATGLSVHSVANWYAASSGGSPIFTGTSFTTNVNTTTSFWVSAVVTTPLLGTICDGPRVEVVATVVPNPALDPVNDVTACDSFTLPAVGDISGTNLVNPKYYTDSQANNGVEITNLVLTASQTVWIYDETGTDPNCYDETSFVITINDAPMLDPVDPVTACDSFTLPAVGTISGTNLVNPKYYTDSQANNGVEITNLVLTASQTVWIYDETGTDPNCYDETSFVVTINKSPALDPVEPVTACDSFTLPAVGDISGTNLVSPKYYDDSQANNGVEITNLVLTASQTVWIYDETGTDPNCYDETSFVITINDAPMLDPVDPVTACDSFTLPAVGTISGTNLVNPKYYTDSQANNGVEITNLVLTASQTVWIYDETGTDPNCYDETSFVVTINKSPALDPVDPVTECDTYTLPAVGTISGTNLVNPKYYTDSQANNGVEITNLVLTASQTVWIYDETGTDPNCYDETSFLVTIEPCADEGCTLGYWKTHTDRWCESYRTCDLFGSVFVNAPSTLSNLTLLEALNLGGGGINNLARQAVAALLNACSGEVDYAGYSDDPQLVINAVNAAYRTGGKEPGMLAYQLDVLNNSGCPLGGTQATSAPNSNCPNGASKVAVPEKSAVIDSSVDFKVYPVPFEDVINVQYRFEYDTDVTIQVFNLQGGLIFGAVDNLYNQGEMATKQINLARTFDQALIVRLTTNKEKLNKNIVAKSREIR